MDIPTHYMLLGVDSNFSRQQLRAAYHSRLFQAHPDKMGRGSGAEGGTRSGEEGGVESREEGGAQSGKRPPPQASVDAIRTAYAVLSDPDKRAIYDAQLALNAQHAGLSVSGAGLDEYTLAEFRCHDDAGGPVWSRNCPRCSGAQTMVLREQDLEEGTPDGCGGYRIAVSCQTCSLWITVCYEEE